MKSCNRCLSSLTGHLKPAVDGKVCDIGTAYMSLGGCLFNISCSVIPVCPALQFPSRKPPNTNSSTTQQSQTTAQGSSASVEVNASLSRPPASQHSAVHAFVLSCRLRAQSAAGY